MTITRKAQYCGVAGRTNFRTTATILGFALAGLLAACGSSMSSESGGTEIRLTVQPEIAAPGETVTLVLTNASQDTLGYNLCTSALERRQDSDWQPVPSDRVCTMELRFLEPGENASYPMDLADTLSAGEYRFSTSVDRSGIGAQGVATEAFTVRP